MQERVAGLRHRERAPELPRDRCERDVQPAGAEAGERGEVAIDVEGKAVAHDPPLGADPDRGDLARVRVDPDPLRPLARRRLDPHVGERKHERALEVVCVAAQILAVIPQVEDRIGDELTRAVPRGAPATVGLGDVPAERGVAVSPERQLAVVARLAERQRRRVLAQHDRVGDRAL